MLYIDFGVSMATGLNGVGFRAWELGSALAHYEDVLVITPDVPHADIQETWSDTPWQTQDETIRKTPARRDIYLFGFATPVDSIRRFKEAGAICIFDAIVWPLEYTTYQRVHDAADPVSKYSGLLDEYLTRLRMADGYLVASEVEKQVLTGMLTTCRFDLLLEPSRNMSLDDLFCQLPVGFSDINERTRWKKPPSRDATGPDFVWNGGLWNHYSPVTAVRGLRALLEAGQEATLWFLYPQRGTPTAAYRAVQEAVAEDRRLAHLVTFCRGGLSLADRITVMETARAALCLYEPHVLWDLCPPMRLRETVLYELPIVAPRRGALGDLVTAHGIGATTPSLAVDDVAAAMLSCLDDETASQRQAAARAAAENYRYEALMPTVAAWLDKARAR
ncbi:hypothetical protein [Streptomyces roseochromogenus]|uniref:Glycosyl transferase family 1 domain-containing protein n=1 Tax=Streptomyces roseochromogenus subsp. oscitans DS 12.976 TaxID=1352936 RepID=V6K4T9_STRRC|nr:hypothetical protein [Streptomyces roseochromogenus]EST27147.1 hypothetical protein M878_25910 [Streptomyces roseochromogenus subsp. oscitans DS 12.976]